MEIKIILNTADINRILEISGYVAENVQLWYERYADGWHSTTDMESLIPIKETVAYKIGYRPKTLDGETPRLEENEEHKLENVIQRLYNEKLMSILF